MSGIKNSSLDLARIVRERFAGSSLTPAQAKLYSQHIRVGLHQEGLPNFSPTDVSERLEEIQLLLDAAFWERDCEPSSDWPNAVKRAGEILEWLAHETLVTSEIPTSLLAAAAYQIAGYPALARGILTAVPTTSGVPKILRFFLEARFLQLQDEICSWFSREAKTSDDYDSRLNRGIIVETIRALGVIAATMRWGDADRIDLAIQKLKAIAMLSLHSQVAYSGLTAQLCAFAAKKYLDTSIWPWLEKLGSISSEAGRNAYQRFGKRAYLQGRSLVWRSQAVGLERLLTEGPFVLCTPTGSGKTMVAELAIIKEIFGQKLSEPAPPDGANKGALALYLVPSRALASEVEGRLSIDLKGIGDQTLEVTGLYGGVDWGPTDAWLTSDAPTVLVCTYEKAEALLRFIGPLFIRRVRCVIIDEAHAIQFDGDLASLRRGDSRAFKLEVLAVRLLQALDGCAYRLIALSAVTAGLEESIAKWLGRTEDSRPAHSNYRSTRQLVGRLDCLAGGHFRIQYDLLDRSPLEFVGKSRTAEKPFIPNPFSPHPVAPSVEDGGPLVRLRPYLMWAAIQLARVDASGQAHSVLISITSNISHYASAFLELLEIDWINESLPAFFSPPTSQVDLDVWNDCLATMKDYFTEKSMEYRLLRYGIVVHHGKMPALLARRLKILIERRLVRIVMATSTLSEGVNLPVEYILVPDVHRGTSLMSAQEFLNLSGRAGRPGHGTEGRTLVLLPPLPSRSMRRRPDFSDRRLIEGYESIVDSIKNSRVAIRKTRPFSPLAELIVQLRSEWAKISRSRSESDDEFMAWLESAAVLQSSSEEEPSPTVRCLDTLDSVLIAALEEISQLRVVVDGQHPSATEKELRRIWQLSFAKAAAVEEMALSHVFVKRGQSIPALYPDELERRQIYKSSLPPLSARELLARMPLIRAHLMTGSPFARWPDEDRYFFVERVVELIAGVARFALPKKVGRSSSVRVGGPVGSKKAPRIPVDWRMVLRWWLDPRAAEFVPDPSQIGAWHEYIAKNFVFLMNWALGSISALSLDTVKAGLSPVALTLSDWPKSGLPWVAFWLKELLTWGTLDPVVAFLLARGKAVARDEAGAMAATYYQNNSDVVEANDLLDPVRIRQWIEDLGSNGVAKVYDVEVVAAVSVVLVRPSGELNVKRLRVLPVKGESGIKWLDVAGYHVASCSQLDLDLTTEALDFLLDVQLSMVMVNRYV